MSHGPGRQLKAAWLLEAIWLPLRSFTGSPQSGRAAKLKARSNFRKTRMSITCYSIAVVPFSSSLWAIHRLNNTSVGRAVKANKTCLLEKRPCLACPFYHLLPPPPLPFPFPPPKLSRGPRGVVSNSDIKSRPAFDGENWSCVKNCCRKGMRGKERCRRYPIEL